MMTLVPVLLALAGLFAERATTRAIRHSFDARLGVRRRSARRGPLTARALWWLAAILGLLVGVGPVATAGAVAVGLVVARIAAARRRTAERRRKDEQLADAVAAMSAGMRAGLSLTQSLAYARDETQPPLQDDLARLVSRIAVGMPVADALVGWAEDLNSEDARLIAGVLDLHRLSGGDLPSVLDGLVGTLRTRRAANREVRALTAQARLSGVILGMLPVGFFGFLLLTSRREMVDAISTPLGRTAVATGFVLEALAFLWIRRLLEVH
jgi:tight adherence protein B